MDVYSEIYIVDLDGNDNDTDHLQWSQNKTGEAVNMMLTADMCLAFDIESDASKKENRSYSELGDSPGKTLVQIYAESNKIWLADFSVAYTKMVEKTPNIQLMAAQPDGENAPCKAPGATTPSSSSTLFPSFLLCIAAVMITKLF
ncbi:hypothetical protein EB796_006016 [Bugula neritina]|uniref:Uncharacterized protein n=1 Tax=Bugula neritina TaxID=10212 RepID=A0A7J7KAG8_BUGNE|nr:hypothetical protein EB796_006016 [Bugula neritina]